MNRSRSRAPVTSSVLLLGLFLFVFAGAGCDKKQDTAQADRLTEPPNTTPPPTPEASAAAAVRTIPAADLAGDGSCLGENTLMCEAAPEPATCTTDREVAPMTVADLIAAGDAHLGKSVTVRGALDAAGGVSCTERGCDRQCCNGCSGTMFVREPGSEGRNGAIAFEFDDPHSPAAAAMACHGDESVLCCATTPPAGEVVVTGVLEPGDGGTLAVRNPVVCTW